MTEKMKCEGIDCAWCVEDCNILKHNPNPSPTKDEIDTHKCEFYQADMGCKNTCGIYDENCQDVENCHFKQNARKDVALRKIGELSKRIIEDEMILCPRGSEQTNDCSDCIYTQEEREECHFYWTREIQALTKEVE